MEYGLIGMPLGHSFSKPIHEKLGGYSYDLCPVSREEAEALLRARCFKGLNVTIPYKSFVIPYCDEIDQAAQAIGAVNTIVNTGGRLIGHNTDFAGFLYLARRMGVSFGGKTVLILGTGGTMKTVAAVARSEGAARVLCASRQPVPPALSYGDAAREKGVGILVNTTPVGMYPNNMDCPLDPALFPRLEAVLDAVYNPLETCLVQKARALGIPASGGLVMLTAQAKAAAEYFLGTSLPERKIAAISREIWQERANLVLVGMPGSGKTSVGRACARIMNRTFFDVDEEVVRQAGKPIADIFHQEGEAAFRTLETQVIRRLSQTGGQVISTGGGSILRRENIDALRQNGVLLHLFRPLEQLQQGHGRPLSQSRADIEKLWQTRSSLYTAAAQIRVENAGSLEDAARAACKAFEEAAQPPAISDR